ncbi:hypothetical protein BSNK01_08790 [Bacillaceae bacterium]
MNHRFCFRLPIDRVDSGLFEAKTPQSQWRDRVGFAPNFPFNPTGVSGEDLFGKTDIHFS